MCWSIETTNRKKFSILNRMLLLKEVDYRDQIKGYSGITHCKLTIINAASNIFIKVETHGCLFRYPDHPTKNAT